MTAYAFTWPACQVLTQSKRKTGMNNLPPTSTTPAVYVPQPKDTEQVGHAFADGKEVKPSETGDIGNECSKCPPESAGGSLQERAVALPLARLGPESFFKAPGFSLTSSLPKLDEVLQDATEILSTPLDQNLSEFDALTMEGKVYMTMGDLYFLSEFASESERKIIEQEISKLQQYKTKLKSADK
ncbi:hypothetical protein [Endozoicomonas sp. YOMI1]|uniref:hypothetical protein n=1 Tax=Endozoicomonas sp. YOMI1 TaxID=2828739 RepID=UPI00214933D4|nr:hypothetical protein [Endozoicomonas sp. YOMI1]